MGHSTPPTAAESSFLHNVPKIICQPYEVVIEYDSI